MLRCIGKTIILVYAEEILNMQMTENVRCGNMHMKMGYPKLKKPEWYVFTMIDLKPHRRLSLAKMKELCGILNLKMVPVEEERDLFEYDSIEELLERAKGKYTSGMNKEGIVIRPLEPVYSRIVEGPLSMKVLNNDYLLKE